MANQAKPDVNTIWGSAGLATAISKAKQALGFVAEIPEYDQFNGMIQQISQFQQHVNQEGVPIWDALTTYGVGSIVKSPVDRSIYRCLNADQLNVPPVLVVGGAVNANWVKLAHTDAEIQALIGLYGVTAANLQQQTVTAFTTAGVAPTFTLTPNPAIPAYAAPLRLRVRFNVAGLPGANTINVSGKGAVNLKQYNSAGAKIDAVITANLSGDIEYDGVDFVLLDSLPPAVPVQRRQGVVGTAKKWRATANGTSANVVCSCDYVVLADAAGDVTTIDSVGLTLNTSAVASAILDGMASGPTVANTWYGVYVWYNPTTGVKRVTGDIAYSSGAAPIAPAAGFTLSARRGAFRTDTTVNKYPLAFLQIGDFYNVVVAAGSNVTSMPFLASGVAGTVIVPTTWAAIAIAGVFAGPSAIAVKGSLMISNGGAIACAPNNSYDGINGAATDTGSPAAGAGQATSFLVAQTVELILESANIYWASNNAIGRFRFIGWRDAL